MDDWGHGRRCYSIHLCWNGCYRSLAEFPLIDNSPEQLQINPAPRWLGSLRRKPSWWLEAETQHKETGSQHPTGAILIFDPSMGMEAHQSHSCSQSLTHLKEHSSQVAQRDKLRSKVCHWVTGLMTYKLALGSIKPNWFFFHLMVHISYMPGVT